MKLLTFCLVLVGPLVAGASPTGSQRAFDAIVQKTKEAKKVDTRTRPNSIPVSILERNNDYNVVMVPASTWACTQETIGKDDDPHKNWRTLHGTAVAALSSAQDTTTGKMFKRLFQYIVGVNSRSASIEMSVPVTNKIVPVDDESHTAEMCFYLGEEYAKKDAPTPTDDKVFIQKREPTIYFVRKFGGWALSNDDWKSQLAEMLTSVKDRDEADAESGVFFTVSFDSPFDNGSERRNEIWIPKKEGVSLKKNQIKKEKLESLTYIVKEKTSDYELREYPEEKWICTNIEDVNPEMDPMNDWQEKYDNNPLEAMKDLKYRKKDRPANKMFMLLFRYIQGVNMDFKEIDMSIPVPTYHKSKSTLMEDQTMCFWLGSAYRDQDPPQPTPAMRDLVKSVTKPAFEVYVREFGGWAMSDMDYRKHYEELKEHLEDIGETFVQDAWAHASYNSPWELENRRNEVWISKS